MASAPFLQAVLFPRAKNSPQLITHVLSFLQELTGIGALGKTGTKCCQWYSCLLAAGQPLPSSVLEMPAVVFNTGYNHGYLARHGPKLFEDRVNKKTAEEES